MKGAILVWLLLSPAWTAAAWGAARGNPGLARRRYQAGVDLYAAGRYPEAMVAFQDAVRLNPQDRAAKLALARVRTEADRSSAAFQAALSSSSSRTPSLWEKLLRLFGN